MKSVRIPLKIDALGYAPNSMKITDLMEILKGSVQRQVHEMARSVLSEFKMRGTVSVPQVRAITTYTVKNIIVNWKA